MQWQERLLSQIYVPNAAFQGIAKFQPSKEDILYELQSLLGERKAV